MPQMFPVFMIPLYLYVSALFMLIVIRLYWFTTAKPADMVENCLITEQCPMSKNNYEQIW